MAAVRFIKTYHHDCQEEGCSKHAKTYTHYVQEAHLSLQTFFSIFL